MLKAWLVFWVVGYPFFMKYLSLLLGASFKTKSIWDDIIEKVDLHLVGWLEKDILVKRWKSYSD
jgi:hypothetical protein